MDEFKHEDVLVTALTERKINAEKIRNIFLGLNEGLVEILGAVSGFLGHSEMRPRCWWQHPRPPWQERFQWLPVPSWP
jgi:VIT1/CCC1 family predicted Fe2+/Mn2+ transporter